MTPLGQLHANVIAEAIDEAIDEAARADFRYGGYTSAHEALGVLIEEIAELTHAIHANALESVRAEAIQVAAVALRLATACRNDAAFARRSVPYDCPAVPSPAGQPGAPSREAAPRPSSSEDTP